jgi:hypothetical protein
LAQICPSDHDRLSLKVVVGLLLVAAAAILVHGYHPGVEDAEIYLPGIKKALNPALYPHNAAFFMSHAHMTLFPKLIALSVRITHLPLDWALLLWHWFSIFLLLLGCWHVGQLVFPSARARWGGAVLVASLLTLPVAGTALYIMDEYLSTRSISTPAVLFLIVNVVERKWVRAALWTVFTAVVHPLMVVFGVSYAVVFLGTRRHKATEPSKQATMAGALLLFPFGLFPPVSDAYREVLDTRPYFFLSRWHWYEWLGIVAPIALLWWFSRIARKRGLGVLEQMSTALVLFALAFFAVSLVITIPPQFANFAELQPMRALHLVYILLFIFAGGLLADWVLQNKGWRWIAFFVPLCAGMGYAQRQIFPSTPAIEWPGASPSNDWVKAFLWIRYHAPADAYFALDPDHMALPGEDQHGFRALAERSRLADRVKDSGAVTMFPMLAETWREQVRALQGWKNFQVADFERLKQAFGVNWVVLQTSGVSGLQCPYHNATVMVCRIEKDTTMFLANQNVRFL